MAVKMVRVMRVGEGGACVTVEVVLPVKSGACCALRLRCVFV